jgi:hypothetical protein
MAILDLYSDDTRGNDVDDRDESLDDLRCRFAAMRMQRSHVGELTLMFAKQRSVSALATRAYFDLFFALPVVQMLSVLGLDGEDDAGDPRTWTSGRMQVSFRQIR